ncbi:hypothetical protein [Devosia aquimaris]|uniref:hypothetical protein n=1 Tax=Devosia aquimaris TaxID=2866214 RepID=UPI001CD193AF|nr:hypothetical protein [Devosia sp. CJK-A8-3]
MNQRARRADAAALAEARSAARKEAAEKAMARSESVRSAMSNNINQTVSNGIQLTSQLVSTRVNAANKAKAEEIAAKADAMMKLA